MSTLTQKIQDLFLSNQPQHIKMQGVCYLPQRDIKNKEGEFTFLHYEYTKKPNVDIFIIENIENKECLINTFSAEVFYPNEITFHTGIQVSRK